MLNTIRKLHRNKRLNLLCALSLIITSFFTPLQLGQSMKVMAAGSDYKLILLDAVYAMEVDGQSVSEDTKVTSDLLFSGESGGTWGELYSTAGGSGDFESKVASLITSDSKVKEYLVLACDTNNGDAATYTSYYEAITKSSLNEDEFSEDLVAYQESGSSNNVDLDEAGSQIADMFGTVNANPNEEVADAIMSPFYSMMNTALGIALRFWGYFLIFQTVVDYIYITSTSARMFFDFFTIGGKESGGGGGMGGGMYGNRGGGGGESKRSFSFSLISHEAKTTVEKVEGGGGGNSGGSYSSGAYGNDNSGGGNAPLIYTLKRVPAIVIAGGIMILVVGGAWDNLLAASGQIFARIINAFT